MNLEIRSLRSYQGYFRTTGVDSGGGGRGKVWVAAFQFPTVYRINPGSLTDP